MYIKVSKAHSTLERNEYVYTLDILEFCHQNPLRESRQNSLREKRLHTRWFLIYRIETIQQYCTLEGEPELPHPRV